MGYSSRGCKESDTTEHIHMFMCVCVYVYVYKHVSMYANTLKKIEPIRVQIFTVSIAGE